MSIKKYLMTTLLAALCFCFGVINASAEALPSGTDSAEIGSRIEAFVHEHEETTAGMSVAVFDTEETLYTHCFGDANKAKGMPVDENTVMEWGSTTKLLVWTSVMQLQEQGKLDLDEDIRAYLPEGFLRNLRYDTPVTMTHLMNHNAGFQETVYNIFIRDEKDIQPLGTLLSRHQPEQVFEPGTVTAYSNWGVALAGYIVERVSGQPFYAYVNQHIFAPLGMKQASIKPDYRDNPFVREQWEKLECYDTSANPLPFSDYFIELYPAGSCASTIGDYTKFAQALLNPDSPLFANPATHELLFTPTSYYDVNDIPRCCHGFWMIAFAQPVYGHGGNTAGCSAYVLLSPENGVGMVVMTNQSGETVYNTEMPELVFGKFEPENYFPAERELPKGIFRPARTVFKGGVKLYSIGFYGYEEADMARFWVWNPATGVVNGPYGDEFQISLGQMIGELALVGLWLIGILVCPVMLLVRLIGRLRGKEKKPLGTWAAVNWGLRLAAAGLLAFIVTSALRYADADSYFWGFSAFAVLLAALCAVTIVGIVGYIRQRGTMKRGAKVFHALSLCGTAVTIANILYWQLFVFWLS